MQDTTKQYKRPKRRRSGRTPTRQLFEMSRNANRLGRAARRIYGTIRLSVTPRTLGRLSRAAEFYGLSLSATARRLLYIADEIKEGKTGQALELFRYFEDKARKGTRPTRAKPRRKTKTAADVWAEANADQCRKHAPINLRLTARNLGDIAEEQDERRLSGFSLLKSFSGAFDTLMLIPLSNLIGLIAAYERGEFRGIDPAKRQRPKRTNRNRAYTEAKRRLLESGTKADL